MCYKSKAVAYISYQIKTTGRLELISKLDHLPLSQKDKSFVIDVINGLSIKELADKYNKSLPRISQWKRHLCERIFKFAMLS